METKAKESKRVMTLIAPQISLFECRVCGLTHTGLLGTGGRWKRGVWQCRNGCTLPLKEAKIRRTLLKEKIKPNEPDQQEPLFETEVIAPFYNSLPNKAYKNPLRILKTQDK